MIKDRDILSACRDRLLSVAGLPEHRVWMNRGGEPPIIRELWIRDTLLVGDELQRGHDTKEKLGIYVVDVFSPKGQGTEQVMDLADKIKDIFNPKNGSLASSIAIDRSSTQASQEDAGWFFIPVHVTWRAYSINT